MSLCDFDRLKEMQDVVSGELVTGLAADRLAMTARPVRCLDQRYRWEECRMSRKTSQPAEK